MDQEPSEAEPIRVLIVDDHVLFTDALRLLLERDERIQVVGTAATGPEAIERALALQADVVVMDVSMPGMDGLEATRRLRSLAPVTRVIVLTGTADDRIGDRAIEAGASACLTKGALDGELISSIRTIADARLRL